MARTHHLGLRLSVDELARVAASAAAAGQSPAAWVRELALGPRVAAVSPAMSPAVEASPAERRLARTVATRLTPGQYEQLEERAAAAGLPVAAYVRAAVLGVPPPPRRRAEVRPAIAALNRVGNNLNQLTKLAHQGTVLPADLGLAVRQALAEVRRVRNAIVGADEE